MRSARPPRCTNGGLMVTSLFGPCTAAEIGRAAARAASWPVGVGDDALGRLGVVDEARKGASDCLVSRLRAAMSVLAADIVARLRLRLQLSLALHGGGHNRAGVEAVALPVPLRRYGAAQHGVD